MYERLSLHYPNMARTEREAELMVQDWLEDLGEFPADLIADACRIWRNSTQRFFPTTGQLLDPVRPIMDHRKRLGRRAFDFKTELAAQRQAGAA